MNKTCKARIKKNHEFIHEQSLCNTSPNIGNSFLKYLYLKKTQQIIQITL